MATQAVPRLTRTDSSLGKQQAKSGKLPVAEPSSFGKFFVILVMYFCKKVVLVRTNTKLAVYMGMISIGSLFFDLIPPPPSYFARKDNIINIFYCRMGWGCTFFIMATYTFLTTYTYCSGNKGLVRQHLTRLFVATGWWYSATTFFNYIYKVFGFCSIEGIRDKHKCIEQSGGWFAFDVSGHAFLLIFNLLVISEEVKSINGWERILEFIQSEEANRSSKFTGQELSQLRLSYTNLTPIIRICLVFVTVMQLVWEFMLITTIMYFHNLPEKFVAACFGVLGWFLIYHVLCKTNILIRAGTTGKEPYFKFMKSQ